MTARRPLRPSRSKKAPESVLVSIETKVRMPPGMKTAIRRAAQATLEGLPRTTYRVRLRVPGPYRLVITVVGSATIRRLNTRFRGKPRPTDVLSFSHLEGPAFPSAEPMVGDVLICWPVARRQAPEWGNTPRKEMQRLTVHGVLHLFGYDHEKSRQQARRMFSLQEKILAGLGGR